MCIHVKTTATATTKWVFIRDFSDRILTEAFFRYQQADSVPFPEKLNPMKDKIFFSDVV